MPAPDRAADPPNVGTDDDYVVLLDGEPLTRGLGPAEQAGGQQHAGARGGRAAEDLTSIQPGDHPYMVVPRSTNMTAEDRVGYLTPAPAGSKHYDDLKFD
jgi:hypothetical protein